MELTIEDIDVLIEAVEKWETADASDDLMFGMMGIMLAGSKENADKILKEQEVDRANSKEKRQVKKERAVLLKAKLIQMKDAMIIKSAL